MHNSGFQVLGPLGAVENRELLCWGLPDMGLQARRKASAPHLLSGISKIRIRRSCLKSADLPAVPPPLTYLWRNKYEDCLAADAPAENVGALV